jgi:hypothetical protein
MSITLNNNERIICGRCNKVQGGYAEQYVASSKAGSASKDSASCPICRAEFETIRLNAKQISVTFK